MLDIGRYDKSIASLNCVVSIFNNVCAVAPQDDDQFDKVVLVQVSIALRCLPSGSDALEGHLKPGGNRFIASSYCDFLVCLVGM